MIKLVLVLLFIISMNATYFIRHDQQLSTGARCLDGTPAVLYMNVGTEHDKFLIYFNGEGFCQGATEDQFLENCVNRSNTDGGSSDNYPTVYNLDNYGIMSTDPDKNPQYWNWTKVFIPYCDGSFHQGSVQKVVVHKRQKLYFRGANNTIQHFKYLNDYFHLYSASKIILTGASAGGIAAFIWSDYLQSLCPSSDVYSIPDSGLFLTSYPNPHTGKAFLTPYLEMLFGYVNKETSFPMKACIDEQKDILSCLNFSNSVKYFKTPLFIVESEYDEYSLSVILKEKCMTAWLHGSYSLHKCVSDDLKNIEAYRIATLAAINNFTSLEQFGAWVPACCQHGFSHQKQVWMGSSYKVPYSTGVTLASAIQNFIQDPKNKQTNIHIDSVQWPQNSGCAARHSQGLKGLRDRLLEKLMIQ